MHVYACVWAAGGNWTIASQEHKKVAQYYESKGNFAKAGQQYEKCQQFQMALKLYLRWCASRPEGCPKATHEAEPWLAARCANKDL